MGRQQLIGSTIIWIEVTSAEAQRFPRLLFVYEPGAANPLVSLRVADRSGRIRA